MGSEVLAAACREPDLEPTCGVDIDASDDYLSLPDGSGRIPISSDLESLLGTHKPDVMVDFTNAEASIAACRVAAAHGVNLVVGTTGLSEATIRELDELAQEHEIGAFVAPNFAIGAVLLVHLASTLGRFFDYAEIVEAHHEAKLDAPSGTSIAIAKALASGRTEPFNRPMPEKEMLPNSRGAEQDGVSIHAMRMQGRVAHQELILGTVGQTLTLRHDTTGHDCYMPGVLTAIRQVVQCKGLVVGLEKLLEL